jgi:hypothetical protein
MIDWQNLHGPRIEHIQHRHVQGKHFDSILYPIGPAEIQRLRANEPEAWELLNIVYSGGPIYSADISPARHYADKFIDIKKGLSTDGFNEVCSAIKLFVDENQSKSEEALKHKQSSSDLPFKLSNQTDVDENTQTAIHHLVNIANELLTKRQQWKQDLKKIRQYSSPSLQMTLSSGAHTKYPFPEHYMSDHHFVWDTVWSSLILVALIIYVIWLANITGLIRPQYVANATGFHIALPTGYTWTALGNSEWMSPRLGHEPYKITINSLESEDYLGIKKIMAQHGERISLPAGNADRLVIPKRGALYLPTNQVGMLYIIDTGTSPWMITTSFLTEAESDALARSFSVP